jgi:membrane protease YdiL (CAAX protease family)
MGLPLSSTREEHHSLPPFFLLTFVLTWTAWMAARALVPLAPTWPVAGPVARVLLFLGTIAPAAGALILTARISGRTGVQRLLRTITRWHVNAGWYVFGLTFMAATKLAAALIQRLVQGRWPELGDTPVLLMLAAIPLSTFVQAGEELGWRGFALPRLARRIGLPLASIVLGVIWAGWHLPLFFIPGTGMDGQGFPVYLAHVTALSVIMAWMYWRTGGSLFAVMFFHASVNNTSGVVRATLPGAAMTWTLHGSFVAWTAVAITWAFALPLLVKMRNVREIAAPGS